MTEFTDEQRSDSNTAINAKLWATCQAEAKRKFRIHPSAYSNGYASKIYKERGGKWRSDSLKEWFAEDWKAINSSGTIVGGCGDGSTKGKVKCLPISKARSLSKKDRSTLAKRKQAKDPKPNREGAPVMVSSKKREDSMTPEVFAQAILSIEQNYGLRLDARSVWLRMDDWRRLGRDQMGQKCGRGWQGLRGACKRVPKGGDKDAAIKASKVALADKIRKRKGLADRNAPRVPKVDPKVAEAKELIARVVGKDNAELLTSKDLPWPHSHNMEGEVSDLKEIYRRLSDDPSLSKDKAMNKKYLQIKKYFEETAYKVATKVPAFKEGESVIFGVKAPNLYHDRSWTVSQFKKATDTRDKTIQKLTEEGISKEEIEQQLNNGSVKGGLFWLDKGSQNAVDQIKGRIIYDKKYKQGVYATSKTRKSKKERSDKPKSSANTQADR